MSDPFASFDRDFARAERRFTAFSRMVFIAIALIWSLVLGVGIACVVALIRVGPEGVATTAGHILGAFLQAAGIKP